MNNRVTISINAIYESAKLIIHSNSAEQNTFWKDYCTYVLTCLINHLYNNVQNMSKVILSDCLEQLETFDPVTLMYKINAYGTKEHVAVERHPNQARFLAHKAEIAVSILKSTLKRHGDKGQYSYLFE